MDSVKHYLEQELYDLFKKDSSIFKFLQEGSLDGVWYWDLENPENEWMSPRFWELLGYKPEEKEHLVIEWQELINLDDLELALDNFHKHCANPDYPYDQIVRYKHKNGSTVWVRCRGVAMRDKYGKPVRMLGAHNDMTKLKQTELELRKKTEELEKANEKLQKTLSGILPICASCKKIRDDEGYWKQIEAYIEEHSTAYFTHSICTDCAKKLYSDLSFNQPPL